MIKFRKNIGTPERIVRFACALLLLAVAWWQMSWIALIAALFVLFESLMSWCILYQILGKNSCPIKKRKH
jgi:hypothetical protein